jgi:hypothetical protein
MLNPPVTAGCQMLPLIRKPQGLTYRLASDFVVPGGAAGRCGVSGLAGYWATL